MGGALAGGAIAHHERKKADEAAQAQAYDQAPEPADAEQAAYAPPPANPADEIEHLAKLHESGALTDEEFAAAKAKAIGT